MKVKICGMPTLDVAEKVCALHPDAIGIYIDQEMGANFTDLDTAKDIVALANKASIETFFLTCLLDASAIEEICNFLGNSHIQLATKTTEISLEEVVALKKKLPTVQLVKVIGVTGEESKLLAKKYEASPAIDQLLLDSKVGNLPGGTGVTHDWNISKGIIAASKKPVWLAGGIRLHTVQSAIDLVNPYGVDVETGVQNPDKSKNYEVIKEFISLVQQN